MAWLNWHASSKQFIDLNIEVKARTHCNELSARNFIAILGNGLCFFPFFSFPEPEKDRDGELGGDVLSESSEEELGYPFFFFLRVQGLEYLSPPLFPLLFFSFPSSPFLFLDLPVLSPLLPLNELPELSSEELLGPPPPPVRTKFAMAENCLLRNKFYEKNL